MDLSKLSTEELLAMRNQAPAPEKSEQPEQNSLSSMSTEDLMALRQKQEQPVQPDLKKRMVATKQEESTLDKIRTSATEAIQENPILRKVGLAAQGFGKSFAWAIPGIEESDFNRIEAVSPLDRGIEKAGEYGGQGAQLAVGGVQAKGLGLLGQGISKGSKIARAVLAGSPVAEQVIASAGGGAVEGYVNPESTVGKLIANIAGGIGAGSVMSLARGAKNSVAGTAAKEMVDEVGKAFERTGVAKTLSSTGVTGAQIENQLSRTFGGGTVVNKAREAQKEALNSFFKKTVGNVSLDSTTDDVVNAAREGVRKGINNFKEQSSKMYDALDAFVPSSTVVKTDNIKNTVGGILKDTESLTRLSSEVGEGAIDPFVKKLSSIKDSGDLKGLKLLKEQVGEKMNEALFSGRSDAALKKVYGAISNDIETAYKGNPEVLNAYKKANEFYHGFQQEIRPIFEKINKNETAKGMLKEAFGQEALPTQKLRQWLPKEDYSKVLGMKLTTMGNDTGGQFNPVKFMREYGTIPEHVKKVMFSGTEYGALKDNLDDFVKVTERLQKAKAFDNMSGTAGALAQMAQTGIGASAFMGAGVAPAILALGGPYLAAKLATSPNSVKALSTATRKAGAMALKGGQNFTTAFKNVILNTQFKDHVMKDYQEEIANDEDIDNPFIGLTKKGETDGR